MSNTDNANIALVKITAKRLGELLDKVVFLGGAVTSLFITDQATFQIRPTQDVDLIVELVSKVAYHKLEKQLRTLGFKPDQADGLICRWMVDGIKVDIMPTSSDILGFTNRWYSGSIKTAQYVELEENLVIKLVTAPYFLATKIEAFEGRGQNDYLASHDLEDIVTVIDGRPEMIEEIRTVEQVLNCYLREKLTAFLQNEDFLDALPGHLQDERRVSVFIKRLKEIIQ